MKRIINTLGVLALASLAACGGGGDNSGSNDNGNGNGATAEGVYAGTLTGSASPEFQMLVLDDGSYWAMYGAESDGLFYFAGFIEGHGTTGSNTFRSSDARDFGFAPAQPGSVNATFDATQHTVNGTITSAAGAVTFNGGKPVDATYDYNTPASLSSVVGLWTMSDSSGETDTLTVAADGKFMATSSSGCAFTGLLTPRPGGKNVFNVSLIFGGAPCVLTNQHVSGIALEYPVAAGTNQLMVTLTDVSRQYGIMAVGARDASSH